MNNGKASATKPNKIIKSLFIKMTHPNIQQEETTSFSFPNNSQHSTMLDKGTPDNW